MGLNEAVVDSVANTNFKVLGDTPASMAAIALQNAVSFQHGMNTVFVAAVARMTERMGSLDPGEAMGVVAAGQVAVKAAGNVPPATP